MESIGGTRASWSDRRESDGAMRGGLPVGPCGRAGGSQARFLKLNSAICGLESVVCQGIPLASWRPDNRPFCSHLSSASAGMPKYIAANTAGDGV